MASLLGQPSTRSDIVYTGFWYDRDVGKVLGATLTLPDTQAAPLIAFLTILTTLAGNRSWYICRYLWHSRLRSKPRAKELKNEHRRRQQVVVRNSSTAGGAVISLLEEWIENGFRKTLALFSFRDVFLALFVLVHWLVFIALGILVSQIVLGGLVVSKAVPSCGEWMPLQNVSTDDSFTAYQELLLNQTLNSESYVRSCYPLGDSRGILDCNKFTHRYIDYHTEDDVECPFDSSTCRDGINSAFSMDSGNVTFSQLGLNSRVGKQISIRKLSTCAVVDADLFKVGVLTSEDTPTLHGNETYTQYAFMMDSDTGANITTIYRNDNFSSDYDLTSYDLTVDPLLIPSPIRPEDEKSSMVGIILLHGIGIKFLAEQDDPFFSAHREYAINNASGNIPTGYHRYGMDHFLNMIACDERAQFCSAITGECTEWDNIYNGHTFDTSTYDTLFGPGKITTGSKEELDFVNAGLLVKSVLSYTSISGSIQGRSASAALQASRYLTGREQLRLQPDQWKIELKYWFATALARLQLEIYNTIEGPANLDKTRSYNLWDGTSLHSLCGKIKFNDANYTSMSTLGIAIVIAFCSLMTIMSMIGLLLPYIPGVKRLRFVVDWQKDEVLALLSQIRSEGHTSSGEGRVEENVSVGEVEKEWSAKNQTGPLLVVSEARASPE